MRLMRVAQLRPLGGAFARVPADATAYAHRSKPMPEVAAFTTARTIAQCGGLSRNSAAPNDDSAYVGFHGRRYRASVRRIRARRGPIDEDQSGVRSDQSVPAQSAHPAGHYLSGGTLEGEAARGAVFEGGNH
jgi:hypothetical protein